MADKTKTFSRHRVFDWFAPLYDLGIWALALFVGGEENLRGKVVSALDINKGSRVLELFCGTGTLSIMAAKKGARVTALDRSRGMLLVAKEKFRRLGLQSSFVKADALSLPFMEESFEGVIISLGLHEIPLDGVKTVLAEVLRVLRPGGRVVIFDFHRADGTVGFLQRALFSISERDTARSWIGLDVQALLKEKGFKAFRRSFLARGALQVLTVEKGL